MSDATLLAQDQAQRNESLAVQSEREYQRLLSQYNDEVEAKKKKAGFKNPALVAFARC